MEAVMAVLYREYLIRRTSFLWLFFDLVVPLLYLIMFGIGFDRMMGVGVQFSDSTVGYKDFFFAGVLSMSCFGSAINQSYSFFLDRDNGIFYEFLTYPMTRGQLLLGKIGFQCLMSVVQCGLTVIIGVWILGINIQWKMILFVIGGVVVGIAGWFFFMAIFAFLIRRNDTYNTIINVAYFILLFMSSMFYPLENLPQWLKVPAQANPVTWHTDVLRYLTIGTGDLSVILLETIGFILFSLLSFWLAVKSLQKVV